ncbi:MAG: hypothetical protein R2748_04675 [Bryobacterales bacterium]
MPTETMQSFPALDYVLRGEPEVTFRELIDVVEGRESERPEWVTNLLDTTDLEPPQVADGVRIHWASSKAWCGASSRSR